MSTMDKDQVVKTIIDSGLVVALTRSENELAGKVVESSYKGGLRAIEITNRSPNALDVFTHMLKVRNQSAPDMVLGVGSIVKEDDAIRFIDAGAEFVVSPVLQDKIADICRERDIAYVPGCTSPSEMYHAYEIGASIIKFFPANDCGGPTFVKAILGPMPYLNIMPMGGVKAELDKLTQWFDSGVVCVGMGNGLLAPEVLDNNDYEQFTDKVKRVMKLLQAARCGDSK